MQQAYNNNILSVVVSVNYNKRHPHSWSICPLPDHHPKKPASLFSPQGLKLFAEGPVRKEVQNFSLHPNQRQTKSKSRSRPKNTFRGNLTHMALNNFLTNVKTNPKTRNREHLATLNPIIPIKDP